MSALLADAPTRDGEPVAPWLGRLDADGVQRCQSCGRELGTASRPGARLFACVECAAAGLDARFGPWKGVERIRVGGWDPARIAEDRERRLAEHRETCEDPRCACRRA